MEDPHPVGYRFRPTEDEIFDHYLRSKNVDGNTSHVDEVISTVDICSFDPWELPSLSIRKETDYVWYFFGRKENKYNRGERQSRTTKSGFWKITGKTMKIVRKRGNRENIGEKRVLVFHYSSNILGGSKPKTEWVMHEYVATFSSPTQTMMTYTVCKVMFKGDSIDLPSSSAGGGYEIEQNNSLIITPVNNSGGGLSSEAEGSSFELQDPRQFSGFPHLEEEAQIEDAIRRAINNLSSHDFNCLLNNDYDDEEQGKTQ